MSNRIGFVDYKGNINTYSSKKNIKSKEIEDNEEPTDNVNHPSHYNWIPNFEVADLTDYFNFNLGNTLKYIIRAGHKSDNILEDLKKAQWYLSREIELLSRSTE